tara:strand:+ start:96 stop:290 length:195 start_codon:yes stop_codon:yes gene_type:complete
MGISDCFKVKVGDLVRVWDFHGRGGKISVVTKILRNDDGSHGGFFEIFSSNGAEQAHYSFLEAL